MYKKVKNRASKKTISLNNQYVGETIEQKVERLMNNKEAIGEAGRLIYTERKDGVNPSHDIRTDRFEIAVDTMDRVVASQQAKREMRIGEQTFDTMSDTQKQEFHKKFPKNKFNTGGEPVQATT